MPTIPSLQKLKRFYKKANVIEHPLSGKVEKLQSSEKVTLNNLSKSHDTYWAVTLDDKVTKTFFKDDLLIPSRSLAIALAEEWESQGETIDIKSLHLHQMIAKAWRANLDRELAADMRKKIFQILENDQICYRQDPSTSIEYKRKLAELQASKTDPLFDFIKKKFNIKLNICYHIGRESIDPSVKNIIPVLEKFDPLVLNSVYQVAQLSKSSALALALVFQDGHDPAEGYLELSEAVDLARIDEHFQQSHNGLVEGAHDWDTVNTLTTFAAARAIPSLAKMRHF